jgi:hypothetical protein
LDQDKIGLRDGLTYSNLVFLGVVTSPDSNAVTSTLIATTLYEKPASLALVLNFTPDRFDALDFVQV